jgi:uncharacterized protein YcbK (DUF882 family)
VRLSRPLSVVAAGALLAGAVAAARRGAALQRELAAQPTAPPEPSAPHADSSPAAPAPRPRRRAGLAVALGLLVLLFAGAAWPGDRPALDPSRKDARAQAEAARLTLLGKLQLAGIASRRAGPALAASAPTRAPAVSAAASEVALARYATAVGADSIAQLVLQSTSTLAQRVLADSRIDLTPAGRSDVASGRVDPRILAVLLYLAEAHGEVGVSCLISGHSRFVAQTAAQKKAREPRHTSAHIYGRAVDISTLGGVPILGNQQPGGVTDRAIEEILALPGVLQPRQVISLLDLSGPSFSLPDHYDHIHVGF